MNRIDAAATHCLLVPALAVAAALALALLLAGCGGGGDDVVALREAHAASEVQATPLNRPTTAAPTVRLEGCVVDDFLQPRAHTPVRALAADGRLLASALSDADGKFRLQVPSGQRISLAVDKTDGDVTKVATGPTRRVLTTCLFDPSA